MNFCFFTFIWNLFLFNFRLFSNFVLFLQVPTIVKALHRQLKEKSMRCRQGCFSLLTEMANVLPGQLGQHLPALIPG